MRLLHTSDWHIGVAKHRVDRRPDHDHIFAQIRSIAIDESVDLILHTGDLFDVAFPNVETLKYGWSVLEELAAIAPVVVLCGNHDGAKLFELMGTILKNRLPLRFVDLSTLRRPTDRVITLPTGDAERVRIAAVPFVKSAMYATDYLGREIDRASITYAEEVGRLEHLVGEWLNADYDPNRDIRIFAAHLLVDGAVTSGSEYRFHVDGEFATKPERIPPADYVAFGHIHKPQAIPGTPHGRYAGSPLPVDFGERDDVKSVYVVSARPGYAPEILQRTLDVGRRMVDIRCSLSDLATVAAANRNTIARVFVQIDDPIPNLEERVRSLLPDVVVTTIVAQYRHAVGAAAAGAAADDREPTLPELFDEYVAERREIGDPERAKRYFRTLLGQLETGDDRSFPDIDEAIA